MPRIACLGAAFFLAALSAAVARQSTLSMTCNQAIALVATSGAIVLSTGRHTFDRFVAGGSSQHRIRCRSPLG
jgi:hypothetical protein